jgi:hypothetical protein
MRSRPGPGGYTAGYVEDRFEKAGRTLLALPLAGVFPAGLTCLWPLVSSAEPRRYPVPTSADITLMDEAYTRWIPLIHHVEFDELMMMRQLVLLRSLVRPDSDAGKPIYLVSWRKLVRATGLHRDVLRARWGLGIDRIVARLNQPGLCAKSGGRIGPAADRISNWIRAADFASTG